MKENLQKSHKIKRNNFITSSLLSLFFIRESLSAKYTPIFIAELFRHGARTPSRDTLNEDYVKEYGPGNIIGNGERMHYILGIQLRKNYSMLFPQNKDTYLKKDQYIMYSTDYERTILSAYSHLLGLFPFDTGLSVTGNLNVEANLKYVTPPYQGIEKSDMTISTDFALPYGIEAFPVNVLPKSSDKIFMKTEENTCPNGYKIAKENFNNIIPQKQVAVKGLIEELHKAGIKSNDIFKNGKDFDLNTTGIYADIVKCKLYYEANQEGTSYKGITPEILKKLEEAFGIFYINYRFNDRKMTKVYTTKMAELILKTIEEKVRGSKMAYLGLSGHEANLVPFMMQYGIISEECLIKKISNQGGIGVCENPPQFAANMIWELSRQTEDQKLYVRVLYNGKVINGCNSPNSEQYCDVDGFTSFLQNNFILGDEEYKKFCGEEIEVNKIPKVTNGIKGESFFRNKILWVFIFIFVTITSICMLFAVYSLLRKVSLLQRSEKEQQLNQGY